MNAISMRVATICVAMCAAGAIAEPTKAENGGATPTTGTKAADAKPKPRKAGQTESLKKAIEELNKEYKDYTAKPESAVLRTTADYFKELPADTTVDDLLAVINTSMSGPPTQQAYVKWQLMSGCPSKVDAEQTKLIYSALGRAPTPLPPVASTPQIKSQLDRAIQNKKVGDVTEVADAFTKEQEKVDALNVPIIGYRNSLIQRLPAGNESIIATLEELVVRLNSGIEAGELGRTTKALSAQVRTWAVVDAKPEQISNLLAIVKKLKAYKTSTTYYNTNPGNDPTKPAKWGLYPTEFAKSLDDLETTLKENAAGGGGGLKFKDDPADKTKKK